MVAVQTATGGVTEELVGAHDVVLMTNQSLEEQQRVDELCRAAGTRFIATAVLGARRRAPACSARRLTPVAAQARSAQCLWTLATRSRCTTAMGRTRWCA